MKFSLSSISRPVNSLYFKTYQSFEDTIKGVLKNIHVPYKASLYTDSKQDLDFGILHTIIEQQLNC